MERSLDFVLNMIGGHERVLSRIHMIVSLSWKREFWLLGWIINQRFHDKRQKRSFSSWGERQWLQHQVVARVEKRWFNDRINYKEHVKKWYGSIKESVIWCEWSENRDASQETLAKDACTKSWFLHGNIKCLMGEEYYIIIKTGSCPASSFKQLTSKSILML